MTSDMTYNMISYKTSDMTSDKTSNLTSDMTSDMTTDMKTDMTTDMTTDMRSEITPDMTSHKIKSDLASLKYDKVQETHLDKGSFSNLDWKHPAVRQSIWDP